MIRKFVLAVAAIAALGTVSLTASTPAGGRLLAQGRHSTIIITTASTGAVAYGLYGVSYDSCLRRRWVVNRYGETGAPHGQRLLLRSS